MRAVLPALAVMLACVLAAPAFAVDSFEPPPPQAQPVVDKLGKARVQLAARRYADAIAELKRVDDRASADWNNLMGYAHRKLSPPDLANAERHYDAALRIFPEHRGALEYSGELYLMKGELSRAEQRLEQLARACRAACEEHVDLRQAVARFKAAGNRYTAAN